MSLILVTGGVRSGKSGLGEQLAAHHEKVLYIATGMETDADMTQRVALHRKRRPSHWATIESPETLPKPLTDCNDYEAVLFDSLTAWVSNRLVAVPEEAIRDAQVTQTLFQEWDKWILDCRESAQAVIVITDEVGLGGVAMSRLGRWFQDVLGELNQRTAQAADEVYAVMSGIPVRIKG